MNVLQVTPAFWPATYWGGPIHSVFSQCNALAALPGVNLRVLTTDAAGPKLSQRVDIAEYPARYPGGYDVYFTRRLIGREFAIGLIARVWPMVRWADVVHLNYTYSVPTIPTLIACRLLRKPLVWSPHGALQATHEWASTRRPSLKKIWEHVCSVLMPRNCVLHVTSAEERTASLARLPAARSIEIPIGVDIPDIPPTRTWLPDGTLRLLFIGRLDPKKGIENLLMALGQLHDSTISLEICGSGDPRYTSKLAGLVDSLGLGRRVGFRGHVESELKSKAFLEADVCVIPSHTENFGIVVAEALAYGVPVIASRGTPWKDVESRGCGLWVDNSPESLANSIKAVRHLNIEEMGEKGREWMKESFDWNSIAQRTFTLYQELLMEPWPEERGS